MATVEETIAAVLGKSVSEAFTNHLQAFIGISIDEMPSHLGALFESLNGSFGIGGNTLGRSIVRNLYRKYRVQFTETTGRTLAEYVEDLKSRLWDGRMPSSGGNPA